MNALPDLIGVGIYSIGEAARLAQLGTDRVRRWVTAGQPQSATGGRTPPLVNRSLPTIEGRTALSFRELIEVRFIRHFLAAGLSWRVIRRAAVQARHDLLAGDDRTLHFSTDGVSLFVKALADDGDHRARDLINCQFVMLDVLKASMKKEFDLEGDALIRAWHPRAETPLVLLDPRRSFGRPIVEEGIPTYALADALVAEGGDAGRVAALYETTEAAVCQAAAFEMSMRH